MSLSESRYQWMINDGKIDLHIMERKENYLDFGGESYGEDMNGISLGSSVSTISCGTHILRIPYLLISTFSLSRSYWVLLNLKLG